MNDKLRKDLIILGALIIVCSFLARFLARGETLEEYAKNNPSAAVSHEVSVSLDTDATDISSTNTSGSSKDIASADASDSTKDVASTGTSNTSKDTTSASSTEDHSSSSLYSSVPMKNSDTATANTPSASATDSSASKTSVTASENKTSSETSVTNYGEPGMNENIADRVTYSQGFYYEPIPEDIITKITGVSYVENNNVSLDDLRYVVLLYNDFNGETKSGEMICNKKIAQDILEIFYELYTSGYQIESIKLIDEFGGDDTTSMLANNTSCFNYRVVENTTRLSNHAYGLAIDLNPFYNPYITYGKDGDGNDSPEGSEAYSDRSQGFPYKIYENDLAYKLFKAHGFKWGGNWNSVKDYQHFERSN